MHHRWGDGDQARHEGHRARERHDEPMFTTLAVGEEGDPDPYPDPAHHLPEEPVFTTMAVGEEGDPDPYPGPAGLPGEPVFTTLAVGEESDAGFEDPWCA